MHTVAKLLLALNLYDSTNYKMFATLLKRSLEDSIFHLILLKKLVSAHSHDPLCVDIHHLLSQRVVLLFAKFENELLFRKVLHYQIGLPHVYYSLKQRVLHIHHFTCLAGHYGDWKLYRSIYNYMYWPALAVVCKATARHCSACAKTC